MRFSYALVRQVSTHSMRLEPKPRKELRFACTRHAFRLVGVFLSHGQMSGISGSR